MSDLLKLAEEKTNILLEQYKEYLSVNDKLDALKSEQMKAAIRIGTQSGQPFAIVLREQPDEIAELTAQIESTADDLQRISDEMTFANPVVWMMYKYKAYQGTSQAITDMQDFRKHCSKPDYICTKRYLFLNEYLSRRGIDLNDNSLYPDTLALPEVYGSKPLLTLLRDANFMAEWDRHEYHTVDGRVAKWENS